MKTLSIKTMALVLAPMMVLAPLAPVFAQTSAAKEGSAAFANLSEVRLQSILKLAAHTTLETTKEPQRAENIERIKSILETLTPSEKCD